MNHAVPHPVALSTRRLAAHRGWSLGQLTEIWDYKELLYFLIWRDIKVRYTQTVLGAGWAILQPVLTTVIFTIFFGRLAGMPSDVFPILFSPWQRWCRGHTSQRRWPVAANPSSPAST